MMFAIDFDVLLICLGFFLLHMLLACLFTVLLSGLYRSAAAFYKADGVKVPAKKAHKVESGV